MQVQVGAALLVLQADPTQGTVLVLESREDFRGETTGKHALVELKNWLGERYRVEVWRRGN